MTDPNNLKRLVIVGGVAGGMSCAARARRLDEFAHIVVLERGPHPSFANCGLPYHIGGEIADPAKLRVQTAESLKRSLNLDVRTLTEAVSIDRENRRVHVREVATGREYDLDYDALVLSTGAEPIKPPIPGIDRAGHFVLRNIPDMEAILAWIVEHGAKRAVVAGGGYIGLEMAEQLRHRGLSVAVAEGAPHIMAPLDEEMAELLHQEVRRHGVDLHVNDPVAKFDDPMGDEEAGASVVELKSGVRLPADIVILGLGARPETKLAREAGLTIGERGGVRVDESMRTNDENIWAVGDAVEVWNPILEQWALVPLAGPANRQGRIAADVIFGRPSRYRGTIGTAVLRLFELTATCTGVNERTLRAAGRPYQALHLHPGSHAGYYPGAHPITLKIVFDPETRELLGAQAIGKDGVDKRIDVLATALMGGMTIDDLAELELAYAPPFGSAKDPVNLAGMAAQNIAAGDVATAQWSEITDPAFDGVVLDVREKSERDRGHIPGSIHIPLGELRRRLGELPKDREIIAHCASGQRSYLATRILTQNGFKARNLSGSWKTLEPMIEKVARAACP